MKKAAANGMQRPFGFSALNAPRAMTVDQTQSVTCRLGKLAGFLGCIARHKHLASWLGKAGLAVCKVRPWCKAFVAGTKVTVFAGSEAGIVVSKATVVLTARAAVVETGAV